MLSHHATCQIAFRTCGDTLIGYGVEQFLLLSVLGICHDQFVASGAPPAKMIEAKVRGNAVDPRIKRTLETKPSQMYIGAQESFLINVLAVIFRASEVNGEAKDRPV